MQELQSNFSSTPPSVPRPTHPIHHAHSLEYDPNDEVGVKKLMNIKEGYLVGRLGDEPLKLSTDGHLLTIAPTREGKGIGYVIPNILAHNGSAFVLDIKGENVQKTATAKRLQGYRVVVLDPHKITDGQWGTDYYNPLDPFFEDPEGEMSDDVIERITRSLLFDPKGRTSTEPIWEDSTLELLQGLLTLCLRFWKPEKRNLREIYKVLLYTEEQLNDFVSRLKTLLEEDLRAADEDILHSLLTALTTSREKTKFTDNALSQARTFLRWVSKRPFRKHIRRSTFSFSDMRKQKMIVYMVVPQDFMKNCAVWMRLILESAVYSQKDISTSLGISTRELRQEQRILFMLDEIAVFGKLDIVEEGVGTLAGRGINLWLIVQGLAQLKKIYGEEGLEIIIQNMACIQMFGSRALKELEYFSKLIGEEFYNVATVSVSETNTTSETNSESHSRTVSNSSSLTESSTISDSFGESRGTNWSEAFGTSITDTKGIGYNKGISQSQTTGDNWTKSKSKGRNKTSGETFRRGLLWSTHVSANEGKGKNTQNTESEGGNTGKTDAINQSFNLNNSRAKGQTKNSTKGGNETTSRNRGITDGRSKTAQKGTSDTNGRSQSRTISNALQRGISVTPKRMPIEDIRSLREKVWGLNQMLYIKNAHPFFTPRMTYIAKYSDTKRYMFPDMTALAGVEEFDEIMRRPELTLKPKFNFFNKLNKNIKIHIEKWRTGQDMAEAKQVLKDYRKFITKDIPLIIEKYEKIPKYLEQQRSTFGEVAVSSLCMIAAMKRMEVEGFVKDDHKLIEQMVELEELSKEDIGFGVELKKYSELSTDDINLSSLSSIQDTDELYFFVEHYSKAISDLLEKMEDEDTNIKDFVRGQERTRKWLLKNVQKINTHLDEAVGIAIDKEFKIKNDFLRNSRVHNEQD